MADPQNRRFPVDTLVMHHSCGPEFINSTDLVVQDWFDRVGKSRGYAGYSRSYHRHPQRNKDTFAQAQYALRKYTKDGNRYGWRLTLLMNDTFNCVAWHCSSWAGNQRSIGIETCGTYTNKKLPEKALMLIADKFRFKDKELNGKFYVNPHNAYIATICPGMITQQLPTLIDMINNPTKWNTKLWPKPNDTTNNNNNNNVSTTNDSLYRLIKGKYTGLVKGSKQIGSYKTNIAEAKDALQKEKEFLKKKVEDIEDDMKAFSKALEGREKEIAKLEKTLKGISQDVEDKNSRIATLEASLDKRNETIEMLRKKCPGVINEETLIGKLVEALKNLFRSK